MILTFLLTVRAQSRTVLCLARFTSAVLNKHKKHKMKFAPQKYELIHFTTATKKHNLQVSIRVRGIEKLPLEQVRVLGVWLDPKLKWQAYARVAQ
jgi:hypothetical protein